MKKLFLLFITFVGLLGSGIGQRVQGTIKTGAGPNEVILAIKPTLAFTATITNLTVAVQIPTSVGPRPTVTFSNLQPGLFSSWLQVDVDQSDGFYTWGFNCAVPGTSNTDATLWPATELDVLRINFIGNPVPPFTARICHYLDGGVTSDKYAVFYVEANLPAVNGGILSDWGNLFYGTSAVNGATAAGSLGTPNAQYSYATVPNIVLPVKFLGVNVAKKDKDAVISWQIENESSLTDRYEIERSINGVDFKKIGTISPKHNGNSSNSYDLTDFNLSAFSSSGIFYYRIKQVDRDGHFVYSGIKNLRLTSKALAIGVYPNPVKSYANISIDIEQDAIANISISDATGKTVHSIQAQLFKGANTKNINMTALSAGSYLLKVQTPTEILTIPVVKAN